MESMRQVLQIVVSLSIVLITAASAQASYFGFGHHSPTMPGFHFKPPSSHTMGPWDPKPNMPAPPKSPKMGHHYGPAPTAPKPTPDWKTFCPPSKHFEIPSPHPWGPDKSVCLPTPPPSKPWKGPSDWCHFDPKPPTPDCGPWGGKPGGPSPGGPWGGKPGFPFPPHGHPPFCPPPFCPPGSGSDPPDCQPVPEPSSIALFGLGALGMAAAGRYRRRSRFAAQQDAPET